MKNKYLIITFLVLIFLGLGIYFIFFNSNQNNNTNDYTADRTEASLNNTPDTANNTDNQTNENNTANNSNNQTNENYTNNKEENSNFSTNTNKEENTQTKATPIETEIATFTTKIYSKDSGRQNNVKITCNTLNNTVVENGSTFSFCNTVGQATTAKGYKKAEIFDAKRK